MRVFGYALILVSSVAFGTFYAARENGQRAEQQAELKAAQRSKQEAEREADRQVELKAEQEAEEIRQAELRAEQFRRTEQTTAQQAARKAAKQAAQIAKQEAAQRAAKQAAQVAAQQAAERAAQIAEYLRRFAQQAEQKTERYLFYRNLQYVGEVQQVSQFTGRNAGTDALNAKRLVDAQEETTKKQVALIQDRIDQLLQWANALARKGDTAAHSKFDQIEALIKQSFDLRVEQNYRMARFRIQVTGRGHQYDTLYSEIGVALRELDAQRVAAERQVLQFRLLNNGGPS
jgi:hypothetical protein